MTNETSPCISIPLCISSKFNELNVGIYACSPMDSTFDVVFDSYLLEKKGKSDRENLKIFKEVKLK